MLSAAEASMHRAAQDDAQWQRQRQDIYAPPGPSGPARRSARAAAPGRSRSAGDGLTRAGAAALVASMDAEDARLTGRR